MDALSAELADARGAVLLDAVEGGLAEDRRPGGDSPADAATDPTIEAAEQIWDGAVDGSASCSIAREGIRFTQTPTHIATGFDDGSVAPFFTCTTQNPNYGRVDLLSGERCMKFYWTQSGYDGTRMDRGAEACSSLTFTKEGWYAFNFYLPSPGFPTDKTQAIAQIFAMGGCKSWAAMVEIRGHELWLVHRGSCVATPEFQVRLASSVPRNQWSPIVLHFVASHQGAGSIEVWFGADVCAKGAPTYRKTGINFAFGAWDGDGLVNDPTNIINLKFGMYNYDDANYVAGESRTIYYDNVSHLVGNPIDAWDRVAPTK